MDAAIDHVAMLHAVADDAAAAMRADWRERRARAFQGVEHYGAAAHADLEALVVVVAAMCAFPHGCTSRLMLCERTVGIVASHEVGEGTNVPLMRGFPIVTGAGIDLQRHRPFDQRLPRRPHS